VQNDPLSDRRARLTPAQRALLEKRLRSGAVPAATEEADWTITPRAGGGPAPASFGQRRLWHRARRRSEDRAYNVYYAIGLRGPLDVPALTRSVRAVIDRHEALHSRFELANGEVLAVAAPALIPSKLPLIDLAGLPTAASREAEGLRIVAELATPRFDLQRGALRLALLRAAAGEHSLLVAVHHVAIDGWSLALFTRDLAAAYAPLAAGGPPAWEARPLQAADFADWQRRRVRAGALADDLAWWRQHLAGAPAQGLAWSGRSPSPGGRATLLLGPDLAQAVKAFAQRERVTLFITLLAALDALLHLWTGETDLIVGTPVAQRGRPEAADIVGCLLNLLPLRTSVAGDPPFVALLQRARDTFLGALAHREPPVEWLAEELLPGHEPGALPWIRVLFNMPSGEAGHSDPLQAGGIEIEPLLTGEMGSEFDWTFYARELASGIRLDLGVNANLLAPGEPPRLLEGFAALLAEVVARPDRRLSELAGALLAPAALEA